ncbi:hypothetical protein BOTBODRAFT_179182 [Botryobasidium botryosum FD-172 SS1]|uniref:ABM domain-containing protein n=1 Tax=Botryobasidium botryosum (strain FD-172 SS1) TaxID=930990 RepID=A0A067M369_BOTB1|nr:hypothetical protein BOTBODRAFT_179182 [Botryobasidium botryosum FD-172 SS1]
MSADFSHIKGKIILVATIQAKPGKVDAVAKAIAHIRDKVITDAEPGTLTYRVAKADDSVLVFEEYANQDALKVHFAGDRLKEYEGAIPDIVEKATILYYEEI